MKAKIHNSLAKKAIKRLEEQDRSHPWKNVHKDKSSWITFDITQQIEEVRMFDDFPICFLCDDGIFRTISDFDNEIKVIKNINLSTLCFTSNALQASIEQAKISDSTTLIIERLGKNIRYGKATLDDIFKFSQAVCKWGRGERVAANLVRHNELLDLKTQLKSWLTNVDKDELKNAIRVGLEIKGLGVSFASKHLRMIAPDRFGVLDEVLNLGLGFSLNSAGYEFFINEIKNLILNHGLQNQIADVESGIFQMTRQIVRSK